MKLYHYASLRDWSDIKNGSYKSDHIPGLGANRRIGRTYMPAWTRGAVFMLLEPEPKNWIHNRHFPISWEHLVGSIGSLLLEVDATDMSQFSVIDRGHMEGYLYQENPETSKELGHNIPLRYCHVDREKAEQYYLESEVSLAEYLSNKKLRLQCSLPEVISSSIIPIEKVAISTQQPKLLDKDGYIHEFDTYYTDQIPEPRRFYRERVNSLCEAY